MNLVICSNYSLPQFGGSEVVIQQIAESMTKFGVNVTILSKNAPLNGSKINGVNLCFCGAGPEIFFKKLQSFKPDHILVYSDYFVFWPTILSHVKEINCKVTLIPVGMNASIENPTLLYALKSNKEKISVITHSKNYQDYITCQKVGIGIKDVIPNGVNLDEFSKNKTNFREKYDIKTKHMLLCVANFFPGKGQEFLPAILKKVYYTISDFTIVVIHSTVTFRLSILLSKNLEKSFSNERFKSLILKDVSRNDIVSAFLESDVFVFPSQKEVAPLVLLEAMAASVPWISLDVGNASDLSGGLIVPCKNKDSRGNIVYNDSVLTDFADKIVNLLQNESARKSLGDAGRKEIEEKYNWDVIGNKYYDALI